MLQFTDFKKVLFPEARRNGVVIGLQSLIGVLGLFLYTISSSITSIMILIGMVLPIVTLFRRTARFSKERMNYGFRYSEAFSYLYFSFLFGLLIATIGYFIGYTYLFNSTAFITDFETATQQILATIPDQELQKALEKSFINVGPRTLALQGMLSILFYGTIGLYIAAFFFRRKR